MEKYKLAEMEQKFADILWDNQPITSRELTEICENMLNWKRTTTYTVLKKLCDRGIFENQKGIVKALISREDFLTIQGEQYLNDSFEGSLPRFLVAFTKRNKLTTTEIDELQNLINVHKEGL